tara:strand:+ start:5178 stop:5528 length:351 start_codon:yes stop_codon:yes gene_type:complete
MRGEIVSKIASVEGVLWSAITSNEGFVEEVRGVPAKFLESTASLLPSMIESVAPILSNVNLGEQNIVTIIGESGTIAISRVNSQYSLVTQMDDGANIGLIRRIMSDSVERLRPIMP